VTGFMLRQELDIAEVNPRKAYRELATVVVALCEDTEQRYHEISELPDKQAEFARRLRSPEPRTEVAAMP